ncbi:MAG: hypothetical protein IT291_07260 [Deltaproteobacteria bacterium]|nr:hypothetical protein [Deltaproteobacteria bacterium]
MTKVKRITPARIRKITGGKDPARLVEEFMIRRGFDPAECLQQRTTEIASWSIALGDDEELEISLEGINRPPETTLYMGINIMTVPIRDCCNVLAAALIAADTLIGAKISLVNYDLVLSVTIYTANMRVDEIDYMYELITVQKSGLQEAILEELKSQPVL